MPTNLTRRSSLLGFSALLTACGPGKSKGTLVVDVGMTLADVQQRSTFPVVKGFRSNLTGSHLSIGDIVFDLVIGDSGARFPRCCYYWLETGPKDDPKLVHINIGVSTVKVPLSEFETFEARVRGELTDHGFRAGHFENKTPWQLQNSGGKPTTGDGRYYKRGDSLVILQSKRMDEQKRDEPPRAGEWILSFDIVPSTSSNYSELVFTAEPTAKTSPQN